MKTPDFESLLQQFQSPLLRYATSLLRDSNAAEDVVQETFVRLIRKPPVTGSDDGLRNWLFHVCRNLALDKRKMDIRETQRRERAVPPQDAANPAQLASQAELAQFVRTELDLLPMQEREALRLKVDENLSYDAIAELLGVARGTVGWLVHRGMQRLSNRLEKATGNPEVQS